VKNERYYKGENLNFCADSIKIETNHEKIAMSDESKQLFLQGKLLTFWTRF